MNTLWWTLTILLMLAGLAGTFLPLIPGTVLILAGAVVHRVALGQAQSIGWGTLLGLTILMLIAQALDLVSGAIGAKYYGATKWGAIGGLIGGIVGIFFGIPGLLLGPLAGVLIGEIIGGKKLLPAGKSLWGSVIGTGAGLVARLVIALAMILWFWLALPR